MTLVDQEKNTPVSELAKVAAELGLQFSDLSTFSPGQDLFSVLPADAAMELGVFPLSLDGETLSVALSDPLDPRIEQRLVSITGKRIRLVVAAPAQIRELLRQGETSNRMLDKVSSEFKPQILRETEDGDREVVDVETIRGQKGVVGLTNSILMTALQRQASDVHIEGYSDRIDVKYRVDGILTPATEALGTQFRAELISRIKVMAELDIAEKRVPQDGRFRLLIEGREVDFRVSVLPTQFGENVVIRILDKSSLARLGGRISLDDLGLAGDDIARIRRATSEPYGLVLVTGPTGSGKTTTLYGAISELDIAKEKIITIEDPVEYQLEGVTQIAVNERKGLNFATGLRSILRHDPDKIMVGEIRDLETAEIAVQAALTGHLVLASVHANSALDVVSRFTHWGVDLYDFVTALNAVFAQRLLRRVCPVCGETDHPDAETMALAGVAEDFADATWRKGKGCQACGHSGYQGRIAVAEHLPMTAAVADAMQARASLSSLEGAARDAGMVPMRQAALKVAAQGVTTLDEVIRVTASFRERGV